MLLKVLRSEVSDGILESQTRANKNSVTALAIASFCNSIIELLEEKGLISFEEFNDRQKALKKRLAKKFADQGLCEISLKSFKDNVYMFPLQCENDFVSCIPLCRTACCSSIFSKIGFTVS